MFFFTTQKAMRYLLPVFLPNAVGNYQKQNYFLGWPDNNPHPLPAKKWKTCRWSRPNPVDSIYYGYDYTYCTVGVHTFR